MNKIASLVIISRRSIYNMGFKNYYLKVLDMRKEASIIKEMQQMRQKLNKFCFNKKMILFKYQVLL